MLLSAPFVWVIAFILGSTEAQPPSTTAGPNFTLRYELKYAQTQGVVTQGPPSRPTTMPPAYNTGVGDAGFFAYRTALGPLISTASQALKIRISRIFGTAAYEAWAAYDKKASGIIFGTKFKRGNRQVAKGNSTLSAQQITMYYSICRTLGMLFAVLRPSYANITRSLGLEPGDMSTDTSTPIGLGNFMAKAMVKRFLKDEFNQPGKLNSEGRKRNWNRIPYEDYTGYKPGNTAYYLKDPTKWQPELVTDYNGHFWGSVFVQPFWGLPKWTTNFAVKQPSDLNLPPPLATNTFGSQQYVKQAVEVISLSAQLDDYLKMVAEYFNNAAQSVVFPEIHLANKYGWGLDDVVKWTFLTSFSFYDGESVVTYFKRFYDAIRPIAVIRHSGLFKQIVAWGGPGQETVSMKAHDWRPYLSSSTSAEYPSGASCICALIAELARRYTGTDSFGLSLVSPPGASHVEPGITPKRAVNLTFATFTEFENLCARSRVIGGVHFTPATQQAIPICKHIARMVFKLAQEYFDGEN